MEDSMRRTAHLIIIFHGHCRAVPLVHANHFSWTGEFKFFVLLGLPLFSTERITAQRMFLGIAPIEGSTWAYLGMGLQDHLMLQAFAIHNSDIRHDSVYNCYSRYHIFFRLLLERCYTWVQVLGVAIGLAGTALHLSQEVTDPYYYNRKPRGALFDILSSVTIRGCKTLATRTAMTTSHSGVCFGLIDVVGERPVQSFGGSVVYLGIAVFFATVLAAFQAAWLKTEVTTGSFTKHGGRDEQRTDTHKVTSNVDINGNTFPTTTTTIRVEFF
jgi:hypothetical protein